MVVLAVIVCSCFANRVNCMKVIVRLAGSCRRMGEVDGQLEQLVTMQNTICGSTRSCSLDDRHNGPRNTLRYKFDNKNLITCVLFVSLSSTYVQDTRAQKPKKESKICVLSVYVYVSVYVCLIIYELCVSN